MVDDQLLPAVKEVGESDLPIGASEGVGLVDFYHREVAELGAELVVGAESGLLFDQEGLAGSEPFGWGYDLRWGSC